MNVVVGGGSRICCLFRGLGAEGPLHAARPSLRILVLTAHILYPHHNRHRLIPRGEPAARRALVTGRVGAKRPAKDARLVGAVKRLNARLVWVNLSSEFRPSNPLSLGFGLHNVTCVAEEMTKNRGF